MSEKHVRRPQRHSQAANLDFPFNPIRVLSAFAPVFVFHFAAANRFRHHRISADEPAWQARDARPRQGRNLCSNASTKLFKLRQERYIPMSLRWSLNLF